MTLNTIAADPVVILATSFTTSVYKPSLRDDELVCCRVPYLRCSNTSTTSIRATSWFYWDSQNSVARTTELLRLYWHYSYRTIVCSKVVDGRQSQDMVNQQSVFIFFLPLLFHGWSAALSIAYIYPINGISAQKSPAGIVYTEACRLSLDIFNWNELDSPRYRRMLDEKVYSRSTYNDIARNKIQL